MGLFGFGKKKDKVIDLAELHKKRQKKLEDIRSERESVSQTPMQEESSGSAFGFLGGLASAGNTSSGEINSTEAIDVSGNIEERKRKLSKRLLDMTNKIEDLENQIYHLQQRIELIERKSGININ